MCHHLKLGQDAGFGLPFVVYYAVCGASFMETTDEMPLMPLARGGHGEFELCAEHSCCMLPNMVYNLQIVYHGDFNVCQDCGCMQHQDTAAGLL